jgi:orotidine-5'-phosphate decarboxylase
MNFLQQYTARLRALAVRHNAKPECNVGLCVGLDTSIDKLPNEFPSTLEGMLAFNQMIVSATADFATAYKINSAFYEQYGAKGWECMERTVQMIPQDMVSILDAKRGDIGNTSSAYAEAFFSAMNVSALTVAPYMGYDSVEPFLRYKDKFTFVLALTSNQGAFDFQYRSSADGEPLYAAVIKKVRTWTSHNNVGFVVGATKPADLAAIRTIAPHECLLIPGVGAQGGDIAEVLKANANAPALINVSRGIIYADNTGYASHSEAVRASAEYYYRIFTGLVG